MRRDKGFLFPLSLASVPLAFLTIAACSTVESPATSAPVVGEGMCTGDQLSAFTGKVATQQLGTEMLASSGARTIRWAPLGSMMTMDYRADRLTVRLGDKNQVLSAACG